MGMFDRIWVNCPRCDREHEFQSQAGECILRDYYGVEDIPDIIKADLLGERVSCECGATFEIKGLVEAYAAIVST